MPNQPAIKFAIEDNFEGFVKEELKIRHSCGLPPYGKLAIVRIRDVKFDRLENASKKIAEQIGAIIAAHNFDIKMTGLCRRLFPVFSVFIECRLFCRQANLFN
jgi:primosomal protein N'